ncbi:cobalamin-dependent protein [Streptomyces sp. NPDC097619]|uniref:cobalamin-dependent protein n=1 Tax=Streptomyces sp. NPDC097619 TaxID=3157228 RepID=UPI003329CFB3
MATLLDRAVRAYGVVVAWEQVMGPVLQAAGSKWESSPERYIEVEHLLSWHVSTALRRSATGTAPDTGAVVVLACVPGERHTLPLEALAAALAEDGVRARMLGASVPMSAVERAVRRSDPCAVALWSQTSVLAGFRAGRLAREPATPPEGHRGPLVLLGGPGWLASDPPPGTARPAGLREALSLVLRASRPEGAYGRTT